LAEISHDVVAAGAAGAGAAVPCRPPSNCKGRRRATPLSDISWPMRTVKVWLDNNELGEFVEKFNAEGYDDMQALFEMNEEEVDNLIIEMKMNKGNEDKFRDMITDLKKKDVIHLTDGGYRI
jgi:hypothetical protein